MDTFLEKVKNPEIVDLLAVVNMNNDVAFVLKDRPVYEYNRYGDVIIGIDKTGTFLHTYIYERPSKYMKAFGGDKFEIPLVDGTVIECSGQWWDGGLKDAEKVLGESLSRIAHNSLTNLKNLYVFTGSSIVSRKKHAMLNNYEGKVYEYREFEEYLKNNPTAERG